MTALYCVPSAAAKGLQQLIRFFSPASLQRSQSITELHRDIASLRNLTTAVSRHRVRSQPRCQSIPVSPFLSIQTRPRSHCGSILIHFKAIRFNGNHKTVLIGQDSVLQPFLPSTTLKDHVRWYINNKNTPLSSIPPILPRPRSQNSRSYSSASQNTGTQQNTVHIQQHVTP